MGTDAVLALVAGIAAFAVSAVLAAVPLPNISVVVLGILYMFVVLAVAHFWGIAYAVPVGVACAVALDWHYIPPTHSSTIPGAADSLALAAYLIVGVSLGQLAAHARRRAELSEAARSTLADEQAALRRVATLVAREPSPAEVFDTVTEEVAELLHPDLTSMLRYETDGSATVVAARSVPGIKIPVGTRLTIEGDSVVATVFRTGRPARVDSFSNSAGLLAEVLRGLGIQSSAGSPIVAAGRLWGVMVAASAQSDPLPEGTESRIGEFTELVATAITNAETRAELTESRARIVATGDEARRRLERDLHDGAQQRLVSLALEIRAVEATPQRPPHELQEELARIREGLLGVLDDLREISRGIHPSILSEGGLGPALKTLARRCAVPVELDVRGDRRLPDQVEVAAYYFVSEALTNAVKHAQATVVNVDVETDDKVARLCVRDDGIGGANLGRGSGLVGLRDRVEALGGKIEITSPSGRGTSLAITLPTDRTSPNAG